MSTDRIEDKSTMKLPLATSLIVIGARGSNAISGPKIIRGWSEQSDFRQLEDFAEPTATQQQQRRRPVYVGYCMGCASLDFEAPASGSSPSLTVGPRSSSAPSVSEPRANAKAKLPQQGTVVDIISGRIIPTFKAPSPLAPVAVDSRVKNDLSNLNDDEPRASRDKKLKRPRAAQADRSGEADRGQEDAREETKNDEVIKIAASLAIWIVVLAIILIRPRSSQKDKDFGEFDDLQLELSPTDDSNWDDDDEADEASGDGSSSVWPSAFATRGVVREQGVRVSFSSKVEVVVLPALTEEDDGGVSLVEAGAYKESAEGVEAERSENQDDVDDANESCDSYERFLEEVNYSVTNF